MRSLTRALGVTLLAGAVLSLSGVPLILAGGPGAFHPEPLADFIDAFVIGDGEDVVLDLVLYDPSSLQSYVRAFRKLLTYFIGVPYIVFKVIE